MQNMYASVRAVGLDVHSKFTTVSMRDGEARVVRRERLDHRDRGRMREQLSRWPQGVPMVLEASFGWGAVADLLEQAGLMPRLCNCYKLERFRQMYGQVKTNQKDADLLSLLPFEKKEW